MRNSCADRNQFSTKQAGDLAEQVAANYLRLSDYCILARNIRHGRLEVDIIASRGSVVAFVEVRMRSSRSFGRPEETVRYHKRRNLLQAATGIIPRLGLNRNQRLRFDVIAVEIAGQELTLRHLPGWFGAGQMGNSIET